RRFRARGVCLAGGERVTPRKRSLSGSARSWRFEWLPSPRPFSSRPCWPSAPRGCWFTGTTAFVPPRGRQRLSRWWARGFSALRLVPYSPPEQAGGRLLTSGRAFRPPPLPRRRLQRRQRGQRGVRVDVERDRRARDLPDDQDRGESQGQVRRVEDQPEAR